MGIDLHGYNLAGVLRQTTGQAAQARADLKNTVIWRNMGCLDYFSQGGFIDQEILPQAPVGTQTPLAQ
jgi:hypothetical protein